MGPPCTAGGVTGEGSAGRADSLALAPAAPGRKSGLIPGSSCGVAGKARHIASAATDPKNLFFDPRHLIFTFGNTFGE